MCNCVECGEEITNGFYHEDSGHTVCDAECGRKQFEDFDERTEEMEIFWTCFED